MANQMVVCDVCFEPYDDVNRVPLVLSCGHTFCSPCLLDLQGRSSALECPSDRVREPRSVATLPRNFALLETIEKIKLLGGGDAEVPQVQIQSAYNLASLEICES